MLGVVFLYVNTASTGISHQPKISYKVSKFKIKK
ncbi:TPA: AgrD family cyclic lactone autoinducer peptide [Clostridioides difficile]|nr:cyclic lactone autoinducer peptide [Clostridioides difficile]